MGVMDIMMGGLGEYTVAFWACEAARIEGLLLGMVGRGGCI